MVKSRDLEMPITPVHNPVTLSRETSHAQRPFGPRRPPINKMITTTKIIDHHSAADMPPEWTNSTPHATSQPDKGVHGGVCGLR